MERVVFLIPAYNEERTLVNIVQRAFPIADVVIVVDDGSKDASPQLLASLALDNAQLTVLTHSENRGMSGALFSGFLYLMDLLRQGGLDPHDIVVMLDADGQHRPEEAMPAVQAFLDRRVDFLLGRRDLSGYPLLKRIGNPALSLWATLLSGHRFYDVECGFRVMRVEAISKVLPYFSGRRYGCAQELAVISARLRLKVDNTFPTTIDVYRKGARIRDGFNNMRMGLVALTKVLRGRPRTSADLTPHCPYTVTAKGVTENRSMPS